MSAPSALPFVPAAANPPLKWAGGKRWLLPFIHAHWEEHQQRRWVEPFAGGAALALGLQPARALLNDANPHLINVYRCLAQGLTTDYGPADNDPEAFYARRAQFNRLIAEGQAVGSEAAQLFLYLNRTGYNGLCRFNRQGLFNVPFGRYRTITYPDLAPYQAVFARWDLTSGDFADIALDDDDLIYADPPYDVPFTSYSAGGFTWKDQQRLVEWLAGRPNPVILSNQATDRIVDLYRRAGFALTFRDAPRRISCNGDRTLVREVVAMRGVTLGPPADGDGLALMCHSSSTAHD